MNSAPRPKRNQIESHMNAKDFFYTVAQMRSAQQSYFKTRDLNVLRAARKLENIVDSEINRVRTLLADGLPG